jgi:serine/threonine-protein kinase HipA
MASSNRKGIVLQQGVRAGTLEEAEDGFVFTYDAAFLSGNSPAVSLTLPKRAEPFRSAFLFPFFANILAEGHLAVLQCRHLKIDPDDLFGRLLYTTGGDVIGSVQVHLETL